MITVVGTKLLFGTDAQLFDMPIANLPLDAIRYRLHQSDGQFAEAIVETPTGIRRFYIDRPGWALRLVYEHTLRGPIGILP